ncbi:MAG: AAA family ATPase [Clostridia bacterium]|nr:AAA family ATPase [Clostridia bacterium]
MKIKAINIREFGGIKDFTADLSDGINVIQGNNESGKSTILAFIRFVLYGMPPRRGDDSINERERALSWDGGVADGSMDIENADGKFRLERRGIRADNRDGYLERHSIVDLATGVVVHKGEQAGEVFLGVPESVFDSTCFVRQLGIGNLDSTGLGAAIENMLFSADENVNTGRVLTRLTAARRQLMPQRGDGGKISELTAEKNDVQKRLTQAETDTASVVSLRATVEKYRSVTQETRKKLTAADNVCHAYDTLKTLKRFDMLHASEKKVADLKEQEKALRSERGHDGWLPDRDYVARLDSLSRRLASADSVVALGNASLAGMRSAQSGDPGLASHADDIISAGGIDSVIGDYNGKIKRKKRKVVLGIILIWLGILVAGLSLYLGLTQTLKWLTLPISSGITVAGFITAVIGFSLIPAAARAGRDAEQYLARFGLDPFEFRSADKEKTEELLRSHADACIEAKTELDEYNELVMGIEATLAENTAEADAVRAECRNELARFGVDGSDEEIASLLVTTADKAAKCAEEHRILLADIEKYSSSVRTAGDTLSGYDEASMRSHLNPEAIPLLETANPSMLKQERDGLAAQLDAGITRLHEAEKNLAAIEAKYENPARLARRLEEIDAELDKNRRLCDALILAHDSIEGAGESLRRRITPRLRQTAGEMLSEITDGKYKDFGVSEDFSVTLLTESGTKSLSSMSGGTKDAAYFALRTALLDLFYQNDTPPLMLDEVFSQFDDNRTAALLSKLVEMSAEREDGSRQQCLIFTCHTREATMLSAVDQDVNCISI